MVAAGDGGDHGVRAARRARGHARLDHRQDRGGRGPWQRADETLDRLLERGVALHAAVVRDGGEVAAAVVYRDDEPTVAVLQLAATGGAAAARAATAAGRPLRLTNVPTDEPVSRALERLGAQVARQHELRLTLG